MTDISPTKRSPVAMRDCNLAKSFELIGDRWTLLILRSALYGIRRFDDFQTDLDIPRSVLANRLAGLVESGIMERREYRETGQRTRVEYPLSVMGQELALPFIAMTHWGDKWVGDGEKPLVVRSKANGQMLSVSLIDERGKPVKRSDIEAVVDPDYARRSVEG